MNEHSEQDHFGTGEVASNDGLVSRLEVIESQPLEQRAEGFDQLAEELLSELQRSDNEGTNTQ